MQLKQLKLIGLWGAAGGAINAFLCYVKLPEAVGEKVTFHWHLIPAGALHGALLAVIAVAAASLAWNWKPAARWLAVPIVGWVSGWISWVPLNFSIKSYDRSIIETIFWPFQGSFHEAVIGLWQYFGFVAAIYYLLLCPWRKMSDNRRSIQVASGVVSGIVGSMWWWAEMKPWYFSLIHGAIWGSLVGYGVWKSKLDPSAT